MSEEISKETRDRNTRIINELEKIKNKYITATFYLNASKSIPECPEAIGAIFDERKSYVNSYITRQELIPLYIRSIKKLANSLTNEVYDVQLLRDNIVLKSTGVEDNSVEFAIGFYFLNSLRYEIPNFVQTYERFTCGSYYEGEICGSEPTNNFLALEKVEGKTASEFVREFGYGDMCLLLLQVYLSLLVANERFGFCHFDLHSENVMIYKVAETAITYNVGKNISSKPITIVVPFIAVIIDFGLSRVVHNGEVLSVNFEEEDKPIDNLPYIDFRVFIQSCMEKYPDIGELSLLQVLMPEDRSVGTNFAKRVINKLLQDSSKYEVVKEYTTVPCKRRKRTTPVTSILDYYEGYPFSRGRKVDSIKILNDACHELFTRWKGATYKTYCKLYVFFYEAFESSDRNHRDWYDYCKRYIETGK